MEVLVRNAEGNLSPKDREYASKKLGKLDRYFHTATKVEIVHREEKDQHRAAHRIEVTVHADGLFLRGEEHDVSLNAAIDKVADKMENRLRRLKSKIVRSHRHKGRSAPAIYDEIPDHEEEPHSNGLVEHKRFVMKPMGLEEALLQLELSGHTFFLFQNENGRTELLYKKGGGGYGLLSPEM
ncbi:MAG: ribosome-associated translation inhibitor RaiA [Armatimonadetes bacterium]|nr:ribosome-associated translation inhibitor RaiA [Armatimonadota bacterium]